MNCKPCCRWGARSLVLALCLFISGCAIAFNNAPVARVHATPSRGSVPLRVHLSAEDSYDPDGRITHWIWDLGDGTSATGPSITHDFEEPGVHVVKLTVRDNRGASSVATTQIEAVQRTDPPTASFVAQPPQGSAPLWVTFDASGSTGGEAAIVRYDWSFGDGSQGTGVRVDHLFAEPGDYVVQLTITDDLQDQDSVSTVLEVGEAAPFVRQFQWTYGGRSFHWEVSIPSTLYYEYRSRPRGVWDQRDYDEYVLDPLDDEFLQGLTDWIRGQVGNEYHTLVECIFHFVQAAITYSVDPVLFYEYPKYPVETLVDMIGDCEDTAILYAALVRTLGAGARIAAVDTSGNGSPDHMITLVPVSQAYADGVTCPQGHARSFWTYEGQLYAFAETTGSPDVLGYYLALGCDPWGLTEADFKIVWDVSRVSIDPKMTRWPSGSALEE